MTKNPFFSYLTKLSFFSIAVCFLVMILWLWVPAEYIRTAPYYIAMYYVVTLGCYAFLSFAPNKNFKFEQAFMITKTTKIIIYAAIFAIVLLFNIEKSIKFAIAYLLLYLIYQIFDTIALMKLIKQHKNNKN